MTHARTDETYPGALGLLAGLLVLLFGVFEACDVPQLLDSEAPSGVHHVSTSERPTGVTAASVMLLDLKILRQMEFDYPAVIPPEYVWFPCGEEDGYYSATDQRITICAEDLEHPGWSVQVAAHEMGHAITDQLADIVDENAADEIAILAMVRGGYLDEMLEAATYMLENWPRDHISGDPHPGGMYRAWELACAESAAEARLDPSRSAPRGCVALLDGLEVKWDARIPRAFRSLHPTAYHIGRP